jgi:hypothetical protein
MKRCAASPALVRVWNGFAGELDRITIPRFGLWKTQRVGLSAPSADATTVTSKHGGQIHDFLS